ncbi:MULTISPECIES: hypothetical protein [Klebsiella]|uniref:hypothetical protein n=1 Tax=Klebsiella TaxID=570 RepID=UPI001CDAD9C1|nr:MULTISPECIES: hypothetical protein [Klebsiella]MEB7636639.1 hypothetical protein [Klebsiella aerogenes]
MYRGTSEFFENGVIKNPYLEVARKPKDTDPYVHEVVDKWFYSKFGIKARSQTIFCSLSKDMASKFITATGGLYHITIPYEEKYSIIFSKSVVDFYDIMGELNYPYEEDEINDLLSNKNYIIVDNIKDVPKDFKGELMLFVENYYIEKVINV